MVGFVGSRAKSRRRRFFLFIFIILIASFFLFFYQELQVIGANNPKPDDSILPDQDKEITSLYSEIEELKLLSFQKDQKINFRDIQINKLNKKLNETKENYIKIEKEFISVNETYNELLKKKNSKDNIEVSNEEFQNIENNYKNLKKINNENEALIKSMKEEIDKLINEKKIKINDNEALKLEYKKTIADNVKLNNLIDNLNLIIKEQEKLIKDLKDKSHHNQ